MEQLGDSEETFDELAESLEHYTSTQQREEMEQVLKEVNDTNFHKNLQASRQAYQELTQRL